MSFFSGIYSRTVGAESPSRIPQIAGIGRNDVVSRTFSYPQIRAMKCDVGAYSDDGFYEDSNEGFCLVSGDPILTNDNGYVCRSQQLKQIFRTILCDDWSVLNRCRGQFAMVLYKKQDQSVSLIADANGSRPLYFCDSGKRLFFASDLETVSAMAGVDGQIDWESEVQVFSFGIPLGDRTKNKKIKVLRNGEMLLCRKDALQRRFYFRWDSLEKIDATIPELGERVYRVFEEAVSIRSGFSHKVPAFLSGGLDSRCVVAVLKKLGKDIKAFNFSNTEEKDLYLARAYAAAENLDLIEIKRPKKHWSWGGMMADALKGFPSTQEDSSGSLVFSGDGGSVGLGRVYLEDRDINFLGRSGEQAFARQFLKDEKRMPPLSYLTSLRGSEILESLIESMRKELSDIQNPEPGKKLFLFFLQNDQRRHLHRHYEAILSHGIELLVPFMDRRFCEVVVSAPAELFLYHNFYHYWLRFISEKTQSVPWQTYPGHLPCPVSSDGFAGTSQWEVSRREIWNLDHLKEAIETIKLSFYSKEWVSCAGLKRGRLLAACLAHGLGLRDYSYVCSFIRTLYSSGYPSAPIVASANDRASKCLF